ncbi:hypothetical protein CPB84DRAFT_760336 [Gymnopilus junonius]|uniref:Uncharacterized protein n=1 Tax=Gymnopilus junonius TaxID=109634 RepID=A0A9P5NX48_GYMJU|nr:hypothetical protein CPB84DRAFT_760336 [Gymnopilus junonius]
MAQCVQTPTATTTEVSTSESLFPTSSLLTSTLPGSVSTSIFRTCTQTNSSVACEPTLTSVLVTLPGNTTVVTVSATGTSDIPITNIITLFGSSCSTSPSTTPSSTPTTTPSSTPPDTSSTSSDTSSSPPPSLITTSSTVTSDGSTFVDFSTLSSSQTPVPTQSDTANLSPSTPLSTSSTDAQTTVFSSFIFTTSSPSSTGTIVQITGTPNNLNGNHSAKKSSNAGPIAGGVIGGIAALALLGFLTWRFIKKQPRFDDIFNKDSGPHYKKRNNGTSEPKPYTYGLVGQNPATNPIGTPPSSPPPMQQAVGLEGGQAIGPQSQQPSTSNSVGPYQSSGNEIGQQPSSTGNDVGRVPNQPPLQHLRNPSLTPLLAGVGAAAAAGGAGAALTASNTRPNSSRPSSSASSQLMGPLVTPAQTQGYVPNSTYPPALQNWTNAQGYVPASTSPTLTNTQGYAPGPSMEVGQSTGLSPNASVNSTGTMPSTYSQGAPHGSIVPLLVVAV